MLDNNRLPVELGIPELADIDDQDLEEEADVKTSMDGKAVQLAIELLAHGYAKRHVSGSNGHRSVVGSFSY